MDVTHRFVVYAGVDDVVAVLADAATNGRRGPERPVQVALNTPTRALRLRGSLRSDAVAAAGYTGRRIDFHLEERASTSTFVGHLDVSVEPIDALRSAVTCTTNVRVTGVCAALGYGASHRAISTLLGAEVARLAASSGRQVELDRAWSAGWERASAGGPGAISDQAQTEPPATTSAGRPVGRLPAATSTIAGEGRHRSRRVVAPLAALVAAATFVAAVRRVRQASRFPHVIGPPGSGATCQTNR